MNRYPSGTGGISTKGTPHPVIRSLRNAMCSSSAGIFGIRCRLTLCQQRADLGEQVIADPGQHRFSRAIQIRHALLSSLLPSGGRSLSPET